jgi:hypothetical protein
MHLRDRLLETSLGRNFKLDDKGFLFASISNYSYAQNIQFRVKRGGQLSVKYSITQISKDTGIKTYTSQEKEQLKIE